MVGPSVGEPVGGGGGVDDEERGFDRDEVELHLEQAGTRPVEALDRVAARPKAVRVDDTADIVSILSRLWFCL